MRFSLKSMIVGGITICVLVTGSFAVNGSYRLQRESIAQAEETRRILKIEDKETERRMAIEEERTHRTQERANAWRFPWTKTGEPVFTRDN